MGLLRSLGLGKDPHVEWMIEAFGAKPGGNVVNHLYQGATKLFCWEGDLRGTPVTFYANPGNKFRGGGAVYLGKAGPQFMGEAGEYRCAFYHPRQKPTLTIDDPRWAEVVRKAAGDPNCRLSFPEEAFERGVGMGRFALEPDCPLDPRPAFPILGKLRPPLDAMSDAVESVYLYPAGVAIEFRPEALTREKLLSDIQNGLVILHLAESMG